MGAICGQYYPAVVRHVRTRTLLYVRGAAKPVGGVLRQD